MHIDEQLQLRTESLKQGVLQFQILQPLPSQEARGLLSSTRRQRELNGFWLRIHRFEELEENLRIRFESSGAFTHLIYELGAVR